MAKLYDMWVCVDCEEVFDMRLSPKKQCPSCTSSSTSPLSKWLNSMENVQAVRSVSARDLFAQGRGIAGAAIPI